MEQLCHLIEFDTVKNPTLVHDNEVLASLARRLDFNNLLLNPGLRYGEFLRLMLI